MKNRVQQLKLVMVYKIFNGQCPNYFKGYFQQVSEAHNRNTRASLVDLRLPDYRSKLGRSTFLYTGGEEWNKIPNNIKGAQSVNGFKVQLKKWMMSNLE